MKDISSLGTLPHYPVMLEQVLEVCQPEKGGLFVDCTFGSGGYSNAILSFPKTKVIALFGSTSPLFTPPLSTNSQVIYKDIKCSPCFQKTCKYNHYDCMNNIHEDEVITYLK